MYGDDNLKTPFFQMVVVLALASIARAKLISKRGKRSVAVVGPSGYDFFGVAPIFSTGSWSPSTGFGSAPWNPSGIPDIPLTQVQVQATHDVAIQVRCVNDRSFSFFFFFYSHRISVESRHWRIRLTELLASPIHQMYWKLFNRLRRQIGT